jgi:hypothetical protein
MSVNFVDVEDGELKPTLGGFEIVQTVCDTATILVVSLMAEADATPGMGSVGLFLFDPAGQTQATFGISVDTSNHAYAATLTLPVPQGWGYIGTVTINVDPVNVTFKKFKVQ